MLCPMGGSEVRKPRPKGQIRAALLLKSMIYGNGHIIPSISSNAASELQLSAAQLLRQERGPQSSKYLLPGPVQEKDARTCSR